MADKFNLSDVFISYSRRNTDFVKKLDQRFKEAGKEVWVDWEDIPLSADWWEEIKAGIDGAEAFIFVITPDSVQSAVCRDEINHALASGKRFIPLLYMDITEKADQEAMHDAISSHNWIFCRENDDFEEAFKKLLSTVETDFEHRKMHTRLLVRAREWEERRGDRSLLLEGSDLKDAKDWVNISAKKEPAPTELHEHYIDESIKFRRQQRLLYLASIIAVFIFGTLSVGLFIEFRIAARNAAEALANSEIAQENALIAEANALLAEANAAEARELAVIAEENEVLALQEAEENEAIAYTVEQITTAMFAFNEGDSYAALPYALDGIRTRPLSLAQITLNQIANRPGGIAWINHHGSGIREITSSPTEAIAATASTDTTIALWDMNNGELLRSLEGHTRAVNSIHFSSDGRKLVSGGNDGRILLWDVDSGEMTEIAQVEEESIIHEVRYSPRADSIAAIVQSGSGDEQDEEVRLYDLEDNRVWQVIESGDDSFSSIAFSPSGETILTGMDTDIAEWPLGELEEDETREPIRIYSGHRRNIIHIAFSPDGLGFLSTSVDSDIIIWDYDDGELDELLDSHTDTVHQAEWLPDSLRVFSVSRDRSMILWNADSTEVLTKLSGHVNVITGVAVSYDGRRALTGSSSGELILWDLVSDELVQRFTTDESSAYSVAYHPTEAIGAVGMDDGRVQLWDLDSGELLFESEDGHDTTVNDLEFTPDGRYLISASSDCRAMAWDVEARAHYRTYGQRCSEADAENEHVSLISDVDVHSDNQRFITAGWDGDVMLWDIETGDVLKHLDNIGGSRMFTSLFAPDGETVFGTANSRLIEIDLETNEIIDEFFGNTLNIVEMNISPDGTKLVTSLLSRLVVVWDIESGEALTIMNAHQAPVWTADFSPDGIRIVSASDDGLILVWDAETGEIQRRFTILGDRVRNVRFSPNGQYLLAAEQGLIRIKLLDPDELIDWVETNRISRAFSCNEQGKALVVIEEACTTEPETKTAQLGENRGRVYLDMTDDWVYQGTAGETLNIIVLADNTPAGQVTDEMISSYRRLDSTVTLVSPQGEDVAFNDDDSGAGSITTNSGIRGVELTEDGAYTIRVASYNGLSLGNYTLVIEEAETED